MQEHHVAHRVRTPSVNRAQHPTARHLLIDVDEAVVRLRSTWRVEHREHDAAHDLHREEHHRRAAEDVPPLRADWHTVEHRVTKHPHDARAIIEPLHSMECHALEAGRKHRQVPSCKPGSRPLWISNCPSRMRHSNSKSPRGGGPDAREPSS